MKQQKYDFYKNKKINYNELSDEIKVEISILGGLDIFTDAHVQGVVEVTTKICDAMQMSYERLKQCVLAAYLHDVGKILIPSAILQKEGKLTDEEYEKMKEHAKLGYDICMQYDNFKILAPIVRAHHESFDGSGYPDHLEGERIPFEASIIKVADVYDALTRKRQYKEGFKQSDAIKIMIEEVEKNRISAKILVYLIDSTMNELKIKMREQENIVSEYENNIEILHDLEEIYKKIYDEGYSKKNMKRLDKYELASGYDMSTNASLLTNKQKVLEKEIEILKDMKCEFSLLNEDMKITQKLAKNEKWYKDKL